LIAALENEWRCFFVAARCCCWKCEQNDQNNFSIRAKSDFFGFRALRSMKMAPAKTSSHCGAPPWRPTNQKGQRTFLIDLDNFEYLSAFLQIEAKLESKAMLNQLLLSNLISSTQITSILKKQEEV
jgi:hypothetical protein